MITKTEVELVDLTPELAKEFSKMRSLPGERRLRGVRLKKIGLLIESGKFVGPTWATTIVRRRAEVKGKPVMYRVDGRHTSTKLAGLSEADFPVGLKVTIQRFVIDTVADRHELFRLFDNPDSVRNTEDQMCQFQADHSDLMSLEPKSLVSTVNAITCYLRAQDAPTNAPKDRGLYFLDPINRAFAHWRAQWETSRQKQFLRQPGIGAAMYSDWLDDKDQATVFWCQVLNGLTISGLPVGPDEVTAALQLDLAELTGRRNIAQDVLLRRSRKAWQRWLRSQDNPASKTPLVAFIPPQANPSAGIVTS